jgi:predicted Zn-dependent peptidase
VPAAGLVSARRDVLHDRVQLPRIYFGMHAPAYGHDAWYAADLLATALTEGKASVMYEDLVYQRRLAQDVGAYVYPTEASGIFLLVATAQPGVAPERLEEALSEHLERVASEPLAEEHLERARNQLLTQHYGRWQTLEQRANMLSHFATFFDDPAAAASEAGRYRSVSAEQVLAFAAQYLRPAQRATLTVVAEGNE